MSVRSVELSKQHGEHHHHNVHQNSASIEAQLASWHANRGDKSFLSAMVPRWSTPNTDNSGVTKNPFKLLRMLSFQSWLLFFSGWFAWTCDGYDFFAVSLTVKRLAAQFGKETSDITQAITLTLLFRSVGALIFGVLADRYGRKWTLVCNLILIAVFELASGFCNTYPEFLAVRSLFGIAMGGIWGQAAATGLENVPVEARGLLSGILQQGYAVGYLLAAVINLAVVPHNRYTWRSLYFIGAGFSLGAAIVRACLPESRQYILARQQAKAEGTKSSARTFIREIGAMLRTNWIRWVWGVCMMTGFNFFSHGSQDLYPTYLQNAKGLSSSLSSKATIISNCGAIVGGTIAGYVSQYVGRRFGIVICLIWTACWIPLWILPSSFGGLSAGAFFLQSGVQGAWGVVPIYLGEVAPPAFRATYGGLVYQLGNMAASAASQIEAEGGKTWKKDGHPDYAKVMGVLIGVVIGWMLLMIFLGPEADGSHFEEAAVATQSGAGATAARDMLDSHDLSKPVHQHVEQVEKPREVQKETV